MEVRNNCSIMQYLTSWINLDILKKKVRCQDVSGKWRNELGSVMYLKEDVPNGKISGTYRTAAELLKSSEAGETADLLGYINTHKNKETGTTTTITFCMAWKTEGSCSAFTGQIFLEENGGQPVIKTTWLLHSPVDASQHNWEATRVGENTFYKI